MSIAELAEAATEIASRDPHRQVILILDDAYVHPDCKKCSSLGRTEMAVTGLLWEGRCIVVSTE